MNSAYLTFLTLLLHTAVFAQSQLKVHAEVKNGSNGIQDGLIQLRVNGGIPPYQYKWSDRDIPLDADKATALTEGIPYDVVVTDAAGNAVKKSLKIPAGSISEHFNAVATQATQAIGKVLFFDPFAALGCYNPVLYSDNEQPLLYPNGDVRKKSVPFIVLWLVIGALFLTIKMGFINIRKFKHGFQLARGRYDEPDAPGQVTHFQALSTALSGTVGLGNIAGVATAVSIGGPGAMFWMIVAGFLGMASKFVECSLSVKYRHIERDGRVFGGPMAYLQRGLQHRNVKGLGKFLAALFAVFVILGAFGTSNLYQSNQISIQLQEQFTLFSGRGFYIGLIFAVFLGVIIIGGIKRIAKVTERVVPFMAGLYVLMALIVIFVKFSNLGAAFGVILHDAFAPGALKGGIIGALIIGFRRAAFSNEAGVGSAPIAHSVAKTNYPISEGFVASVGPFIDTVVICTLTGLVLILTDHHQAQGLAGVELTSAAFSSVLPGSGIVLTICVFFFGLSTILSWGYYGMRGWTYLFGRSRQAENIFKLMYCLFAIVGASVSLGAILNFSDAMILCMAFPNFIGLYILSGEVRSDLSAYLKKLKNGELFQRVNYKVFKK
ncbi:MAG: amino acid carrier protein [Flavobacteriales bacterium]